MARKSRKAPQMPSLQEESFRFKAAQYIRLSVEDTQSGSTSIETQALIIERYLKQHPEINVVQTYIDNGCTGTNFHRPGFQQMLSDIEDGHINCVIVKDLSRLGRNSIDTGYYIENYFRARNIRFISVNEQYDTSEPESSSMGIMLPLINMVNEAYSLDISKKIKAQQRQAMKDGKYVGSRAPYGYKKAEDDCHQLIIDPQAASVVKQIFQWAAEGVPLNAIVLKLNEAGHLTPSYYKKLCGEIRNEKLMGSGKWQTFTVSKILRSPVYTGDLVQGHTKTVDHKQIKTDEDLIIVRGTHEPIISHELFERVQKNLDAAAGRSKAKPVTPYSENLLKGKIFCGCCGKPLHRHRNARKTKADTYMFYCLSKSRVSKDACEGVMIAETKVMSVLVDTLLASMDVLLGKYAMILEEPDLQAKQRNEIAEKIARKTQEIARLKGLSSGLYESYVERIITKDEYLQFKERYDHQCQGLELDVEQLKQGLAEMETQRQTYQALAKDAAAIRKSGKLTSELIDRLIEQIVIDPSKEFHVAFRFSCEFEQYLEVINQCKNM